MAQFSSLASLVTDTVRRLRQVPGTQTQLYSETVISSYIQEAYYILKQEAWWPFMMKRVSATLDGVSGMPTGTPWSAAGITDFTDIRTVYLDGWQLPIIGEDINPQASNANFARYVEPLSVHDDPTATLLFRVWPATTSGTIYVWARVDPIGLFSNPAIVIPMNKWLLINYAAWRYMTDDAANPGAAAAALQAYEKVKMQELERINNTPIWLDSGRTQINDQWQEY